MNRERLLAPSEWEILHGLRANMLIQEVGYWAVSIQSRAGVAMYATRRC
jgi:hypothetical protein